MFMRGGRMLQQHGWTAGEGSMAGSNITPENILSNADARLGSWRWCWPNCGPLSQKSAKLWSIIVNRVSILLTHAIILACTCCSRDAALSNLLFLKLLHKMIFYRKIKFSLAFLAAYPDPNCRCLTYLGVYQFRSHVLIRANPSKNETSATVSLRLGQRLQRWPCIKPTLGERLVIVMILEVRERDWHVIYSARACTLSSFLSPAY